MGPATPYFYKLVDMMQYHDTMTHPEVQANLKIDYRDYKVDQVTLVMDVFGGYSKNLIDNISKIINSDKEVKSVIRNMQKTVIKSEANLSRVFKLKTLQ